MRLIAVIVLAFSLRVEASTYYVSTTGNNGNDGSQSHPWLTISYSAAHVSPGDIVRVQAGTFDERAAVTVSGSSGSWITWVCDGNVVCRGFDLTDTSYLRFVGFEITHTSTSYLHGITLNGTCSHVEIIDNNIHDIDGTGIRADVSGCFPSYITARGNTINFMGHVTGVYTNVGAAGISSCYISPHHWLVEYNTIKKCPDAFLCLFGTNNIARNNAMTDFQNSYWGTDDSGVHSDIFQDGSGGVAVGSRHHLYEANWTGDCVELNSHFGLWQDTVAAGDTNMMLRGNVAYNFGSGVFGVKFTDKVSTYNNTLYKTCQKVNGAVGIWYNSGTTDYSISNLCANTIIDDYGLSTAALQVPAGNQCTREFNLGYLAGTDASYVSTSDPSFINAASHIFRLQAGSPAINAGTNVVWVTSADASGTSFDVNDGQLLIDGWGIVDGDTITVGGTTTRITAISANTVTVANTVTWTNGMPVYWLTDTTPDIGALPYGSMELTAATITQSGTTYTVTPTGDCRGVWFYVDGIPTTWDSTPPYQATFASGTVTAKAYALYAQANPVVTAGGGAQPASKLATLATSKANEASRYGPRH